jgi:hypothetical protein
MPIDEYEHPADALAVALSRASGILASVSNCYNDKAGEFALNDPFVVHALRTVETFIGDASSSLASLYRRYDLSVPKVERDEVEGSSDAANDQEGQLANSYDELLERISAAEILATEQPGPNLLPVLADLRDSILRIRSAA